jgi:hypothetical protein
MSIRDAVRVDTPKSSIMPGFVSCGEVSEFTFGDPCILKACRSVGSLYGF